MNFRTLEWKDKVLLLTDQRLLPNTYTDIVCRTYQDAIESIKNLTVRGAPAIGVTAAYGMVLAANQPSLTDENVRAELARAGAEMKAARPTAVNLAWAVDRILGVLSKNPDANLEQIRAIFETEAIAIHEEDAAM